jgi:hypothetical protein
MLAALTTMLGYFGFNAAKSSAKLVMLLTLVGIWLTLSVSILTSVIYALSVMVNNIFDVVDMLQTQETYFRGVAGQVWGCMKMYMYKIGITEGLSAGISLTLGTFLTMLGIRLGLFQLSFLRFVIGLIKAL